MNLFCLKQLYFMSKYIFVIYNLTNNDLIQRKHFFLSPLWIWESKFNGPGFWRWYLQHYQWLAFNQTSGRKQKRWGRGKSEQSFYLWNTMNFVMTKGKLIFFRISLMWHRIIFFLTTFPWALFVISLIPLSLICWWFFWSKAQIKPRIGKMLNSKQKLMCVFFVNIDAYSAFAF